MVKWMKPFEDGFKTNGSSLTISSFQPLDGGEYICRLENGIEPSAERRIRAWGLANDKPNILKPNIGSVRISEGDDITLNCQCELCELLESSLWVQENDQYEISQNNDTEFIAGDEQVNRVNYRWILKNVSSSNNGIYTCSLENEFGSDELSIRLNVEKALDIAELKYGSHHRCIMNKHVDLVQFDTDNPNSSILSKVYDCNLFGDEKAIVSIVLMGKFTVLEVMRL